MLLTGIPGFIDLPNANLAAHQIATDDSLVKLNQNAKFGAVRTEILFMGFYKHGDTVPTPVSPVDNYQYSRSEILYEASFYSTRAPGANFSSGQATAPPIAPSQPANLYWKQANINDATGLIDITVSYYKPGGSETISHDGMVKIFAFAQRQSVNTPS